MMEKWFIFADEETTLALRFNPKNGEVVLGGYGRLKRVMEHILTSCFNLDKLPRPRWTQHNKVRFVFKSSSVRFNRSLELLEEHGYSKTETKSHERIMR